MTTGDGIFYGVALLIASPFILSAIVAVIGALMMAVIYPCVLFSERRAKRARAKRQASR